MTGMDAIEIVEKVYGGLGDTLWELYKAGVISEDEWSRVFVDLARQEMGYPLE